MFWVLGFGLGVLVLGFHILGFGVRVSCFGFWVLSFVFWILGFVFREGRGDVLQGYLARKKMPPPRTLPSPMPRVLVVS